MKPVGVVIATAALAIAHPHQHEHDHMHHHKRLQERAADPNVEVVTVAGPTVVLYSLNGHLISDAEVQEGIANGTLVWANGAPQLNNNNNNNNNNGPVEKAVVVATSSAAPADPSPSASATSTTAPAPSTPTASPASSAPSTPSGGNILQATGLDQDFPDNVSCDTFPSAYGALNLGYLGLGGWTGIQQPGSQIGGYSNIATSTSGSACPEGAFCSYACPAGYQKSQWPDTQGATGQSVGGLQCKGGLLQLTNPSLSKKLCITGTSQVQVTVENQLGQQVSVCRTDYPGTESMTDPTSVAPGATQDLTCPDADSYYKWKSSSTSAQYYVNPAGVGIEDACRWGDSSKNVGNWAPLVLGIGWSNGAAWVSIQPNTPTTTATLDFTVTVSADASGQTCTYKNGVYTGDGATGNGCTISATSGLIKYMFSS